jgi:hypothetical protein
MDEDSRPNRSFRLRCSPRPRASWAQTRSHSTASSFDGADDESEQQQLPSRLSQQQQLRIARLTAEQQQLRQSSGQQQRRLTSAQRQLSDLQTQLGAARQQLSRALADAAGGSPLAHGCTLCFDAAPSTLTQCCRLVRVCGPCMRRLLAVAAAADPAAPAAAPADPAEPPAEVACPNCQQTAVDSLPFSLTRVVFDVRL